MVEELKMGTNRVQITDLRPFCNGSWCPSVTLSWSIKDIPHLRVEGSRNEKTEASSNFMQVIDRENSLSLVPLLAVIETRETREITPKSPVFERPNMDRIR